MSRQINLRVNESTAETLEAVAYVRGVTVSELIRLVVTADVDRERGHPAVQMAMEARAAYQGEADGTVRHLRSDADTETE